MADPRALLAEIRSRAEAATTGPWKRGHDQNSGTYGVVASEVPSSGDRKTVSLVLFPAGGWATGEDATFTAAARTDVPMLLSMLESVLEYCDERMEANPRHPDGRPDPIIIGLQMAATDIRRRLESLSG